MKIGDEIQLQVYSEICCDHCGDVIHNHIDCPVCKVQYADTDQYCDLMNYEEKELTCEGCGTVFSKTSDSWYADCTVRIVSMQ